MLEYYIDLFFFVYFCCPSFHIVFVIEIRKSSVSQSFADQIMSA